MKGHRQGLLDLDNELLCGIFARAENHAGLRASCTELLQFIDSRRTRLCVLKACKAGCPDKALQRWPLLKEAHLNQCGSACYGCVDFMDGLLRGLRSKPLERLILTRAGTVRAEPLAEVIQACEGTLRELRMSDVQVEGPLDTVFRAIGKTPLRNLALVSLSSDVWESNPLLAIGSDVNVLKTREHIELDLEPLRSEPPFEIPEGSLSRLHSVKLVGGRAGMLTSRLWLQFFRACPNLKELIIPEDTHLDPLVKAAASSCPQLKSFSSSRMDPSCCSIGCLAELASSCPLLETLNVDISHWPPFPEFGIDDVLEGVDVLRSALQRLRGVRFMELGLPEIEFSAGPLWIAALAEGLRRMQNLRMLTLRHKVTQGLAEAVSRTVWSLPHFCRLALERKDGYDIEGLVAQARAALAPRGLSAISKEDFGDCWYEISISAVRQ